MKIELSAPWIVSRFLPVCAIALAFALVSPVQGQDSSRKKGRLEGSWYTEVTLRDCQTRAPLRTFPALNTFTHDELLIDTTTAFSPAFRSAGHGTWEKTGGQSYAASSVAFLFNGLGAWSGTQKLTHSIEIDGDRIDFTSTVEISDITGQVISRGCATAVGRRQ